MDTPNGEKKAKKGVYIFLKHLEDPVSVETPSLTMIELIQV